MVENPQQELALMIDAARQAGRSIMSLYRPGAQVDQAAEVRLKGPGNPITQADLAADGILRETLLGARPGYGWLSEETADTPERLDKRLVYVVDPIDGTKEYIVGLPEFAISIGLVEDGAPVVACIYNPAKEELFTAIKGEGAFLNGAPIRVSERTVLTGARCLSSRSETRRGEWLPFADELHLTTVGSIAYKLSLVAVGRFDLSFTLTPKNEWDICAGLLLVEEAGGQVSNQAGEPLRFNQRKTRIRSLLATNGHLHPALLARLAQVPLNPGRDGGHARRIKDCKMTQYNVYGIGHALVDVEAEVEDGVLSDLGIDKGVMTLVDGPRQEEIIARLQGIAWRRSCGGSAANTIIGLSQFGGRAFFSCQVADDDMGRFFAHDLDRLGVGNRLPEMLVPGATGRCVVMITPDAERTMCTHLGISETFSESRLVPDALAASQWLYVEGYLVTNPTTRQAAVKAVAMARAQGVKVALTFSDPGMVSFFRDGLEEMMGHGVDLLFCNEAEALQYGQGSDLNAALVHLQKRAPSCCITRGGRGALVVENGVAMEVAGFPAQAVDTNGAGDLFAGAFLYGITHGFSYAAAGSLACRASAKLVTQFGARLQAEEAKQVLAAHV